VSAILAHIHECTAPKYGFKQETAPSESRYYTYVKKLKERN
jgi:hypothetical protein